MVFAFGGGSGVCSGLGQTMYRAEPVFRATIDACDRTARSLGMGVVERFREGHGVATTDARAARRSEIVHLGVIEIALCDLWAAAGVAPTATLALGLGEITSCYASGALMRGEVVVALCALAGLLAARERRSHVFTIDADSRVARELCRTAPRRLDLAGAVEPRRSMVCARPQDAVEIEAFLADHGVASAGCSAAWPVPATREDARSLERALADLAPRAPRVPMFSAIAGRDVASEATFDARHWQWLIGRPCWFADATAAALRDAPELIVNLGAETSSTPWIRQTAKHLGYDPSIIDALRRDEEIAAWAQARRATVRRPRRRGARTRAASVALQADRETLDLAAPHLAHDPFAELGRLRRAGPVHYLPRYDAWLVVGDREVREAFARPDRFSSRALAPLELDAVGLDPPEHTRARRAMSPHFSTSALVDLGAFANEEARAIIEDLAGAVEFDIVRDFAAPLGERVVGRLLGLDDRQLARVRAVLGGDERADEELVPVVAAALADTIANPQPVHTLLWMAGTTNTKRLIASTVLLLLNDTDLRETVSADPSTLPALIDETLRLHPPQHMLPRVTTADVVLGGVRIPASNVVFLSVAAANRDPRRFADPDDVNLARKGAHVGFGAGPHRCPGARLALIEVHAALTALLARMPDFSGAQPACTLRWIPSVATHALESLVIAPGAYFDSG